MSDSTNTQNDDGVSLIDIIAFFLRLRKKLLFSVIIAVLLSVAIYIFIPVNAVPSLYKVEKYARAQFYYHIPDSVLISKIPRLPRMFMEQLISDAKQLSDVIEIAYKESKHIPIAADQALALAKQLIDGKQISIEFNPQAASPSSWAILDLWYPDVELGAIILKNIIAKVNNDANTVLLENATSIIQTNYALLSTMDEITKEVEGDKIVRQIQIARSYLDGSIVSFSLDFIKTQTTSIDKRFQLVLFIMIAGVCLVIFLALLSNYIISIKKDPKAMAILRTALGKNDTIGQ